MVERAVDLQGDMIDVVSGAGHRHARFDISLGNGSEGVGERVDAVLCLARDEGAASRADHGCRDQSNTEHFEQERLHAAQLAVAAADEDAAFRYVFPSGEDAIVRVEGKIGHPIDVVGLFGSAEFLIYFGTGVLFTAIMNDPRPCLAGIWAVAIMSHLSLFQRVFFAWKRYRFVDPAALVQDDEAADEVLAPDTRA